MGFLRFFRPQISSSFKQFSSTCYCLKKGTLHDVSTVDIRKIRNTGILAHIDAGKTTTTERMLYYSGTISEMGDVHRGNTVTDFMEQERNRGITIASASVSFQWKHHIINLVDTPGHIDFTMEVEQSLKAMDSAIIVLDASAGVEAQTVTVWHQADRHKLPRIVYVNKCDRTDASVDICLQSLRETFEVQPLLLHFPVRNKKGLVGLVDLITLEEILWSDRDNFSKKVIDKSDISYKNALEMRDELTDSLATLDDELADLVISKESLRDVTYTDLLSAVRRVTIGQKGIPVLCGSSYKNVGVQMLMDAVTDFLPSPVDSERHCIYNQFGNNLAARVFKIMHDKQRGPITFLRMYSGHLEKGNKVYNVDRDKSEVVGKLMFANAKDFEEVPRVSPGCLVAVTGLKEAVTGDLICSSSSSFKTLKEKILSVSKTLNHVEDIFSPNSHVPDPVFFCSIEPPSQAYQIRLDRALAELQREDPSLTLTFNSQTGQTVLAGMGELHLEVIKDRIKTEYNIDVYLGPLQIVYKEQLISAHQENVAVKNSVGGHVQNVTITLSLCPGTKKDLLILDTSKDSGSNLSHISTHFLNAVKRGIQSALMRGPLLSYPVVDVHAVLHWLEVGRGTSETMIAAASSQCVQKILKTGGTRLLEPIMLVVIGCNENFESTVLADISKRRSKIVSIDLGKNKKEIKCEIPLAELLGFARELRTLTSGTASCSMSFLKYQQMTSVDEKNTIEKCFSY